MSTPQSPARPRRLPSPRALLALALDELTRPLGLFARNSVCGSPLLPRPLRMLGLRLLGLDVRSHRVDARCWFTSARVSIAEGAYVNAGCCFDAVAPISIGPRVHLGPEVMLCTSTHLPGTPQRRAGEVVAAPIDVGAGCWIGARAVLLPGVSVGAGTVVAAGAVVTGDCEPDALYAGIPARLVRRFAADA